jgi:hypothetical protein
MPALERILLIGQPILFAAAILLSRFVVVPAPATVLLRPISLALILAALALVVARLLTGSWVWAALWSSLFVVFTLREAVPAGVLAAFLIWWFVIAGIRRFSGRPMPSQGLARTVARASGIYSLAFLVVAGASAVAAATSRPGATIPQYSSSGTGGPNVYVLLLDAYPRADTLSETFGIDNAPLLEGLTQLGFDVAGEARSNYNKTWLAMASLLNGRYVEDLLPEEGIPPDDASQIRWLRPLVNDAAFIELARERGYTIRSIPPPITSAALTSADDYIDRGHLNEFEATLLWSSPWALLLRDQVAPLFITSHEQTITDALRTTVDLASSPEGPQFVLSHIHSPHPPFALHDPASQALEPMDCFPAECSLWQSTIGELTISLDEYREALRVHLAALNAAILASTEAIVAADPEAVVILISDHGLRYSLEDTDEHFKSFLAARTPGHDDLFATDESPVNVLRRVASAYWGADLEPLRYRAWWSDWAFTLRLTEIPAD